MHKLDSWCERMTMLNEKCYATQDKLRRYIAGNCEYGDKNFCDGKAIGQPSEKKAGVKDKPPCKHFVNGKCELELHKRGIRDYRRRENK